VGAGIAGLSAAYLLSRAGKKVIVLDAGEVGGGETGRTTAHLACAIDDRFYRLESWHGEEGSRLAAESHAAAIDRIEEIAAGEGIACEFERVDGYLFGAPGEAPELLDRELEAARRAGLDVGWLPNAPLPGFDTGPCLRFARQAQFHPLKYLAGLRRAIERMEGRIYGQTRAAEVEGGPGASVRTAGGPVVFARAVLVATNTPFNDLVTIHTKQAAYQTYALGLAVPAGVVPRALYWDNADPYHYVRLAPGSQSSQASAASAVTEILIAGGEDHKTGQPAGSSDPHRRLEAWVRERFPAAGPVEFAWSGEVLESVDGLAFIGRNPRDESNVFIATGDSGMGLTHGTIAGILITDLILDRPNPWAELYDPARITFKAAGDYTRENLNMAAQYASWLTPGDHSSVAEIPAGGGAVIRRGLKKVAVTRDADGSLHEYSAVCPHLGCIVAWNAKERTWDCPCHGSRFDTRGEVIHGPAIVGLTRLAKEEPRPEAVR
jgi:glycine/D-amino acid oxidase-like deaminating enzyme/nitrite reductase/ring-hydroxylating ferredoxin subunit